MDFITREQARQDIIALRLPQIVLDAFDEKPLPYNLDLHFREPYHIFVLSAEGQAAYGRGRITPIWVDCGGYTTVAYHHTLAPNGFIRFDIESPEDVEQSDSLSWQQLLVGEFKLLWEAEWPDEQLREVAGWFGFKHVDLLIDQLPQAGLDTFEKRETWYRSFLERVG